MGPSVRDRLLILGSSLLPLTVWWFVLLPGNFTIDSIDVVNQIRSGTWNDWHTNAYTFFAWATSFGGRVWSFITLSQVVLMALAIASMGWALCGDVVSTRVSAAISAIFAALPQVGSFAVTMWKDVPSTAGVLMLTAALIEWRKRRAESPRLIGLVLIGALLLASFRWNGPVALAILCLVLLVAYRKSATRIVLGIALAALMAFATLVLPQRLKLAESTTWFNFEVRELHDLAYVYHSSPSVFRESDLALLAAVMPLSEWKSGGSSCEGVEVLQYKNFARYAPSSFDIAKKNRAELRQLWQRVAVRAPLDIAAIRLCRAGGVISPVFFGAQPTLGLWYEDSVDRELVRANYVPVAESILTTIVRATSRSETSKTLVLNAMLWNLIAMVIALQKKRIGSFSWITFAVGVSVMASVALGANAHDARYVAGALLVAQYFVLVSVVRLFELRKARTTATG